MYSLLYIWSKINYKLTMKTYLPYFMRKIGIVLFLIGATVSFIGDIDDISASFTLGFAEGGNELYYGKQPEGISTEEALQMRKDRNEMIFTDDEISRLTFWGFLISITGLLLYVFSKEKVDDEFHSHLRGKSMVISVAYTWSIFIILKLLNWGDTIDALSILQLQMLFYIVVYAYQKKWKYWV